MFKLIKNGKVYAPKDVGNMDILIINDKIVAIGPWASQIFQNKLNENLDLEIYDASNKLIFPGLVDSHIHIIGGGSLGLNARTKEVYAEQVIRGGITTAVGMLGLDSITRSLKTLLVKAKALEELGITTRILTGSYGFPSATFTGSVEEDLVIIDKVIGAKLALGDPLANHPSNQELKNLLAQLYRGGRLSGKPGFLHVHVWSHGKPFKKILMDIMEETGIPASRLILTHLNRHREVFEEFMSYMKKGGYADLTASYSPSETPEAYRLDEAMRRLRETGIPLDHITLSSDSNSSRCLPDLSLKYLPATRLLDSITEICRSGEFSISEILTLGTQNPATFIGLGNTKGSIEIGKDADLLILDEKFELESVITRGNWAMKEKAMITKDLF
jgi:beta-aspartyl-dipeptidase (metallo-type)